MPLSQLAALISSVAMMASALNHGRNATASVNVAKERMSEVVVSVFSFYS